MGRTQPRGVLGRSISIALLIGASSLLVGCGSGAFLCQEDGDCQDQRAVGICQPIGFCSFPDNGCESGQRFGEHSGELGGMCVPEGEDDDGLGGETGNPPNSSTTGNDDSSSVTLSTTGPPPSTTDSDTTGASMVTTATTATTFATTTMSETDTLGDDDSSGVGPITDSDLVLWIDFDDGDFADRSDYQHEIDCVGPCPTLGAGPQGNAAEFVSSTGYLQTPEHPHLDFSGDFTVTMWARVDGVHPTTGRGQFIAQVYDGAGGFQTTYDLSTQVVGGDASSFPYGLLSGGEGSALADPDVIEDPAWHFYSVVVRPGSQQVSIDGQVVMQGTIATLSAQEQPIVLGGVPSFGFPLLGALDDVRVYRRALDEGELDVVMDGSELQ